MPVKSRWRSVLLALLLVGSWLGAASSTEQRGFSAALTSFQLGFWERAENEFAEFVGKFPESEHRAEAILRQAQSRYKLTNSAGVVTLLSAELARAGRLADEYHFWLAEAHFQNSNYVAAAEQYALVRQGFTNSTHFLEASYGEALAHSKLGNWPRVIELLGQPGSAFRNATPRSSTNGITLRGVLLLGEAQLARTDYRAAEETLRSLAGRQLGPELDWRRHYLLGRIQLAEGRDAEALQTTTNLLALAAATGQSVLLAESVSSQAGILERFDRLDEAIAAYEKNLSETAPPERRRQALLKITELRLRQNQTVETVQRLERFLSQYPNDPNADVALLSLGELHLKEYLASPPTNDASGPLVGPGPATNRLQQAFAEFETITQRFPDSPLAGRSHLNRGWCLWVAGQVSDSLGAFKQAADRLPFSEDQAVARFKLADCQFRLNDFAGALTNYSAVVENYGAFTQASSNLFEPALYQILRASLELDNMTAATNALARILHEYPDSFICDQSALLVGQKFEHRGDAEQARKVFADALAHAPNSPLAPEIQLATARTYEQRGQWTEAIGVYDAWVTNFANHESRPQAEFYRAWANDHAGNETNALMLFTNFAGQFPTNELAPLAQNWVANHYYNANDYLNAESSYRFLFQKWPSSPLAYQARLMAGRAATARDRLDAAMEYFTNLTSDLKCPPDLVAEALLLYGDTFTQLPPETNNPSANFEEAIRIFSKIPQLYPTNKLVPLALGRIGDCYHQIGQAAKHYEAAINAYQQVLEFPRADVTARSAAEVGIGLVLEKQAKKKEGADKTQLLKQALNRYLNVVLETNLSDNEQADPFWLKKAGLAATRLAEELEQWEQAANLYERLMDRLPSLRPTLEKKLSKAREQLSQKGE